MTAEFDSREIVHPEKVSPLLITAEHAGNAIPAELRDLGVPADELKRHIGWDIGAAGVARRLADAVGATAVLARVSRLVIDLNRPLGDPECIPAVSDGTRIPGNENLSEAEIARRVDAYFWPYHHAIDAQIARHRVAGIRPAILAVHSFTPALRATNKARPWHIGVMFSHDDSLARHLMAALRTEPDLVVGENEPYSGFTLSYSQKIHGLAQDLPHAQIEIRQDLIEDENGQARWADIMRRALAKTGVANG